MGNVMIVGLSENGLKESRWYEHFVRFILGGIATVTTGAIAKAYGPAIGGLFLAVPVMLCASATLVEKHQKRRKAEAGLSGEVRGRHAAALDALGAALGSVALGGFALTVHLMAERAPWISLWLASLAWCVLSLCVWGLYKRVPHHKRRSSQRKLRPVVENSPHGRS